MNPYLRFGPAGEPVAWLALALGAVALVLALRPRLAPWSNLGAGANRYALVGLAACAALLSWAYVAYYLRGGPRIVDAAYYALQAKTFAHGSFTFAVPEPTASFHGRFLLQTPDDALGVLFPPGYAAALAAAFWIGAPLAFGPAIAAALVPATYWLARELGAPARAALGAAVLGVLSAALRYHTADTMSHGWAALLTTVTLAAATRGTPSSLALAGFSGGWLVATRPVTGIVILTGAALLARPWGAKALWLGVGALPGALLIASYQRSLTGDFFTSPQLAYYALADGPPGCFRYGLGTGIGCLFEHGDFVRARLGDGYGPLDAISNTLRRLGVHSSDIANAAPLAVLVPYGAWISRRERSARVAAAVVAGVVVGYGFFYFEASYPGGGARLFADVLPIEHVFVAWALASLRGLRFAWPLALAGFALHAHRQHAALRDREGGRPMFEHKVVDAAGVRRGLVFVSTDHGFALGHEPGGDPKDTVFVARRRNDALDALLWARLGRPPAFAYDYSASSADAVGTVRRLAPETLETHETLRIEAEHLWPPIAVERGWTHPEHSPLRCASGGRGLRLRGTADAPHMIVRLPPMNRPRNLVLGWLPTGATAAFAVAAKVLDSTTPAVTHWTADPDGCARSGSVGPLPVGRPLDIAIEGSGVLDYMELTTASVKDVDN
jgi:hypothetical protein